MQANPVIHFGFTEQRSATCRHVFKWTHLIIEISVRWKHTHTSALIRSELIWSDLNGKSCSLRSVSIYALIHYNHQVAIWPSTVMCTNVLWCGREVLRQTAKAAVWFRFSKMGCRSNMRAESQTTGRYNAKCINYKVQLNALLCKLNRITFVLFKRLSTTFIDMKDVLNNTSHSFGTKSAL